VAEAGQVIGPQLITHDEEDVLDGGLHAGFLGVGWLVMDSC
jgi:hypothetical protein